MRPHDDYVHIEDAISLMHLFSYILTNHGRQLCTVHMLDAVV